jgi:signal transduction histidine kinase
MPIPREAPVPSDSLREAKKYHLLLLALERATREIRTMERRGRPDIDEVLDSLLPDLAKALNAKQAFVALLWEDEGRGKKWLELTVAHPGESLRGYRLECTGPLQQLIEDGKPKVIDPLGEESPGPIPGLEVLEATSAVLVRMRSADQVRVVGICNKYDPDLGPYLAADGRALDYIIELVAIGARIGEQLSRTDAVAFMGAWGADVVHEVNREVGAIRRVIDLLQQRSDLPPEIKERLQEIDCYAENLALPELPEQAPESGRILEFRGAPLLDKVIRAEVVSFRHVHPSISWQLDLDCPEIRVAMHQQWLRRLVRHLIRNAVKVIPPEKETRLVTVRTRVQDSMAEIQVEDTGKGVRPEIKRLLFRRPIPHPGSRPGRGLILVLCVTEQHGGKARLIWSRPGEGACFAFSVPLAQPEIGSEEPESTQHLPEGSDEQSQFGR